MEIFFKHFKKNMLPINISFVCYDKIETSVYDQIIKMMSDGLKAKIEELDLIYLVKQNSK